MKTEKFTFPPGHDGADLAARLDLPDGPHLATALFAHCFTCGKDILAARRIAARLTAAGIAVLRFDFTGLGGHSGGEFENTSFTSNVTDLTRATLALTARGMKPSLLIGHSLGGGRRVESRAADRGAEAVVTIGAPAAPPDHVAHNFGDKVDQIARDGVAEVNLGGRPPLRIGKGGFLDDIAETSLQPAIRRLGAALLVLHAPRDAIVGIENAQEIFVTAKHPKSFVTLDDADHLLSRGGEDAEYAADVIAAWAQRYLTLTPPAPPPIGAPLRGGLCAWLKQTRTGFCRT